MSGSDIAVLLPMAIGFALSPAAIVELILVLFSRRRVVNSIAFVVALLVLTTAALLLGSLGSNASGSSDSGPSTVSSIVVAVFGLLLLVMGVVNWRNRADTSEPPVFQTIAGMGPAAVAFLSLGVTFINPKNLPLLLSAGSVIAQTDAPLLAGAFFLVVGTLPYTGAMLYSLLGGEPAQRRLDAVRAWLIARNRLIMGVLCTLLGLVLLAKGLTALL
jgi:hypothetical protein